MQHLPFHKPLSSWPSLEKDLLLWGLRGWKSRGLSVPTLCHLPHPWLLISADLLGPAQNQQPLPAVSGI